MVKLIEILDTSMCLLWIVTYTLVLIGTVKYKKPLISPITQMVIAPFEFAVLINMIIKQVSVNYAVLAYAYWSLIEIAIICVILICGYVQRKNIIPYILLTIFITLVMCYFVIQKREMFFFSYFNTFIGELIWFAFILKRDYPMKPISLAMFISKFLADLLAIPVYFGRGTWFITAICVLLPILDFAFIVVYAIRNPDLLCKSNGCVSDVNIEEN